MALLTIQSPYRKRLAYRRAAIDDCDLLFVWANDPLTRENAHNKEPIQYDAHVAWFKNKLDSLDSWILIIYYENTPAGLLGLDKKEDNILVTYSVAPEYRGNGIGTDIIASLPDIVKNEKIRCKKIIADVYRQNIASIKIFQSNGYQKHDKDKYYTFIKNVDMNNKHVVVIATTRDWNIKLAKEMKSISERQLVHVITQREELNIRLLDAIQPDYVFFPHWSWKIPSEIFTKYRCVVFHMTDLPFGRGGSPLQNLIVRGITDTKISALSVTDEVDAGDIYLKRPLSLYGTAEEIFIRASKIIFNEMIPYILCESPVPVPQNGTVTKFSRRTPDMSEIKKEITLEECYDHIRMLDAEGYPQAFIRYGNLSFQFSRPKLTSKGVIADVQIREVNLDE